MEIKIHLETQFLKDLSELKRFIEEIREIEKEHNCHCTILEVSLVL